MDDELEAQTRELHSCGEISDKAFRELLAGDTASADVEEIDSRSIARAVETSERLSSEIDEEDVNEELAEIIRESRERGYRGTLGSPEGQTCEREGW
jgi:endonuclease YncB( thermonuclease family)